MLSLGSYSIRIYSLKLVEPLMPAHCNRLLSFTDAGDRVCRCSVQESGVPAFLELHGWGRAETASRLYESLT
jgi:hypothetical protein